MNEPLPHDFNWDDIYTGQETDHLPPDPLMLELASAQPIGDVLDVGCGAGGLLAALGERGFRLHGVDVAPRAIEAAERVLSRRGLSAELRAVDAAAWTPSRSYDLVTNCFALPLTYEAQRAVFATIRDAVAPGGTVIIKDFDTNMNTVAQFAGIDLVEVAQLREAFDGFEILRAEVVSTPVHDHGQGVDEDSEWTAALLVARRPPAS